MLGRAGRTASGEVSTRSVPSEMVTGTAQACQMSYLSKTIRLRISEVQDVAGWWCRASGRGCRRRGGVSVGGRRMFEARPDI